MFCYNCGCQLSEHDYCTACGADVSLYKKIMHVSNMFYNEGLEKAGVRDLSGAINSLRQSLKRIISKPEISWGWCILRWARR